MGILSFFKGGQRLHARWSYTPGGVIWRLLPSAGGIIVGESRLEEEKQVEFFAVDVRTGTPRWQRLRSDVAWWIGVEAVSGDRVYLHEFERPDMPGHAGIRALDLQTGSPVWHARDLTFWFADAGHVLAFRAAGAAREICRVRASDGSVEGVIAEESEEAEQLRKLSQKAEESVPDIPVPVGPDGPLMERFRHAHPGASVVGDVESLEKNGRTVFSYHVSAVSSDDPSLLEHRLSVLDGDARMAYRDVLHRRAHVPVHDAVFSMGDDLFVIRDGTTLDAIGLDPARN